MSSPHIKVAIVGMGVAGSYLYRLLSLSRIEADCFDIRRDETCGCSSCAWGVEEKAFVKACRYVGLNPKKYIYRSFNFIDIGVECKANLCTINKPKFLRDLRKGAFINFTPVDVEDYDIVVDATGVDRALLPPVKNDRIINTIQYKMKTNDNYNDNQFIIEPVPVGYWWHFPLSPGHIHVGCGNLITDPKKVLTTRFNLFDHKIICSCDGEERLSSPLRCMPIVHKNIYGVGESIGCTMAGCGAGIIPSIECAIIFTECLINNKLDQYEKRVLCHFRYLERDAKFLDRLISGEGVRFRDALLVYPNVRKAGIYPGIKQLLQLARRAEWKK